MSTNNIEKISNLQGLGKEKKEHCFESTTHPHSLSLCIIPSFLTYSLSLFFFLPLFEFTPTHTHTHYIYCTLSYYSRAGKLKTLSLARNNLKTIGGLEPVAGTLEELWLSYNSIDRLKGIEKAKNLKVLYMSHNRIKDVTEIDKLVRIE